MNRSIIQSTITHFATPLRERSSSEAIKDNNKESRRIGYVLQVIKTRVHIVTIRGPAKPCAAAAVMRCFATTALCDLGPNLQNFVK